MEFDRDDLKAIMAELLHDRPRIDLSSHEEHHEWIQQRIESERARKEMYWEISKSVAQWSAIGLIGGVIYWINHGHWPS